MHLRAFLAIYDECRINLSYESSYTTLLIYDIYICIDLIHPFIRHLKITSYQSHLHPR